MPIKNSYISSVALVILFAVCISSNAFYGPTIELNAKAGTKRHLGRAGMLIPIQDKSYRILYTSIFSMYDSKSSFEGNAGLGVRQIMEQNILGVYGFWDVRRNKKNSNDYIQQINIGGEVLFENLELRGNAYIPINNKRTNARTQTSLTSNYTVSSNQTIEKIKYEGTPGFAMPGYDIDIGGSIPTHRKFRFYTTFYHFFADDINMIGTRLRTDYAVTHYFLIEAEGGWDDIRDFYGYAGLKLRYSFGKRRKLSKLQRKMNLLPERDIDIVLASDLDFDSEEFKYDSRRIYILSEKEVDGVAYEGNNIIAEQDSNAEYIKQIEGKMNEAKDISAIHVIDENLNSVVSITDSIDGAEPKKSLGNFINKHYVHISNKNVSDNDLQQAIKEVNEKFVNNAVIVKYHDRSNAVGGMVDGAQLKKDGFTGRRLRDNTYQPDETGSINKAYMDNWRARRPNDRLPEIYFCELTDNVMIDASFDLDQDPTDTEVKTYSRDGLKQKLRTEGVSEDEINRRVIYNFAVRDIIEASGQPAGPGVNILRDPISFDDFGEDGDFDTQAFILWKSYRSYTRFTINNLGSRYAHVPRLDNPAITEYIEIIEDPITRAILVRNGSNNNLIERKRNLLLEEIVQGGIY